MQALVRSLLQFGNAIRRRNVLLDIKLISLNAVRYVIYPYNVTIEAPGSQDYQKTVEVQNDSVAFADMGFKLYNLLSA